MNDAVNIKVSVKNVNDLTVNVYAINQKNYYKQYGQEVDINMNLDGLSPNYLIKKEYKENPFLLRSRTIEIKELKEKRGVFLIDILGNGKRARCLIRKGHLRYIARQEFEDEDNNKSWEYVLNVLGHQNKAITKARVTLNGKEYLSDDKGNIFIPFAQMDMKNAPIILEDVSRGEETATLQFFDYRTENYTTESGLYLDRESLIESQTSTIFVRPNLFLNEQPVSCSALQDPSLLVKAYVGGGGQEQSVLIKKFRLSLSDKRESTVEYDVPAELRKIELILHGKVYVASQNKMIELSNSSTFEVNAIDDSEALGQCVLVPQDNKYILKVAGKNNEPLQVSKLTMKLKHKYFKELIEFKMQTDKDGNIKLGELTDIEYIEVVPDNEQNKTMLFEKQKFVIPVNTVNIPEVININHGKDVLIPLITENIAPRCDVYDVNFIRIYENVQFNAGYLKISGLPPGNFIAMIRDTQNVDVRINVTKGIGVSGHVVGSDRIAQLSEPKSLQIVQTKGNRGGGYKVKLDGYSSKYTRVHAISSFGVPQFNAFEFLASPTSLPRMYNFRKFPLEFTPDQSVSAEEDYVYKRRQVGSSNDDSKDDDAKENNAAQRFGNILDTPSLLLNKWTSEQAKSGNNANTASPAAASNDGASDENDAAAQDDSDALPTMSRYGNALRKESDPSNLNTLGFPARMALNLEPDKSGVVSIPADILEANHNLLTIVALDDNNTSVKYEKLKPVSKVPYSDTRLNKGLDVKKHFSEVRDVKLMQKDEKIEFGNWPTTTLETYDDFSDVFELYYSIADMSDDKQFKADLNDFTFLANWSNLNKKEKMAKYDAFNCNEFNFFLKNKDNAFFKSVVVPLLSNRLQKSFFDLYLLGSDEELKKYQRLDLYRTLNCVEKVLLASVVGGQLAENTVKNISDICSLRSDHVQKFNDLFERALNAKQFEVTSLTNLKNAGNADSDESGSESKSDDEVANADGDLSRQYQESRYYKVDYSEQSADLIKPNAFWLDYAKFVLSKGNKTFLSKNFGFAASNTAEALLALSVISLPFRGDHEAPTVDIIASDGSTKLKSYQDGATLNVTVNGPTMLLVRSLEETKFSSSSLGVATNYFDPSDRFETIDFEQVDKFVDQSKFVCGKTYGCRVVITNVSSVNYQVELLCQIPTGSIPVNGGFRTKGFVKSLSSYATASLEYYFYFPQIGEFQHYPAQISRNGMIIGYSLSKSEIGVVDEASISDKNSWQYITSSKPDPKDVLENVKNSTTLRQEDLSKLAWRCADEKFFKEITNILRRKQLFNAKIWRYSLVHAFEQEAAEYLVRNDKFMALLAPALTGENTGDPLLLNYNAYERNSYRHVEFFKKDENVLGLFNTRIHENNLLKSHQRFQQIYRNFLIRALYRSTGVKTMSVDDQFCAIFHLIATNDIKQANAVYKAMDAKAAKKASSMMYDYVGVFLSFFEKEPAKALEKQDVAHKWLATKLPSTKRKMWQAVKAQLAELQNRQKTLNDFQDTENAKKAKAAAPKLNFVIDAAKKQIRIKTKNIQSAVANFYAINIEQLFSNSPFTAGNDALHYVQPTTSVTVETVKKVVAKKKKDSSDEDSSDDEEQKKNDNKKKEPNAEVVTAIEFPKALKEKSNFVLEVLAGDLRVAKTQYNNSLYVELNQERGDLFVGNFSKFPVVKAYIKVYLATKMNPNGFFLKDGYTDLRGRFDYLSTNSGLPSDATKVAILVVSESCGANIYYGDV